MNRFQVGDLVRVRMDARDREDIRFLPEMEKYKGNCFYIKEIDAKGYRNEHFLEGCQVENSTSYWYFHESWLDFAKEKDYKDIQEKDLISLFT